MTSRDDNPRRRPWQPSIVGVRFCLGAALIAATVVASPHGGQRLRAQPQDASIVGQWSAVQTWAKVAVHSHLLPSGMVLFSSYLDDARLWNPANGAFATTVPAVGYNIFCAGHSYLADGRLLLTGGHISNGVGEKKASIYDPATNAWTSLPDMNAGRWYPTNTTLADGSVLVTSGSFDPDYTVNTLPQVWTPGGAVGSWRDLTTADVWVDLYPMMHVTPSGKVFMAGPQALTRLLDTSGTGLWTDVDTTNAGIFRGYGTSVMYEPGKVLLAGGGDPPTAIAEVIDLNAATPAWRTVAPMATPRRQLNATVLPDGTVLVTGGSKGAGFDNLDAPADTAELWNPATEQWTTMANDTQYRGYHSTALLLPDARVLSAGGNHSSNSEVFSPPYLFKGARPVITSAPATASYGTSFLVQTADATSIAKVSLIRLSSVTHSFNMDQRFVALSFTQASGGLTVTAPAAPELAPPGPYMLFLVNTAGVPSVASMVRLGGSGPAPPTAPAGPTGLSATAASSTTVNLSWTDASQNEDSFQIERAPGGSTAFVLVSTKTANTTTHQDTGLSASTSYAYRVRAANGTLVSGYSNVATTTTQAPPGPQAPAAPTNLRASTTKGSITLSWAAQSAGGDVFSVERSAEGTAPWVVLGTTPSKTWTDTAYPNSKFVYYRVRTYRDPLYSSYSNTAKVKPPRR